MSSAIPLVFGASLIYVIAASIVCDDNNCRSYYGYAVAVGVVSLIITLLMLILRFTKRDSMAEKAHRFVSLFLCLWWLIGAAIGTFKSPFTEVGNGYFAAWAAFLFSTVYAYESNTFIRTAIDKGAAAAGLHHTNQPHATNTWNNAAADTTTAGTAGSAV